MRIYVIYSAFDLFENRTISLPRYIYTLSLLGREVNGFDPALLKTYIHFILANPEHMSPRYTEPIAWRRMVWKYREWYICMELATKICRCQQKHSYLLFRFLCILNLHGLHIKKRIFYAGFELHIYYSI